MLVGVLALLAVHGGRGGAGSLRSREGGGVTASPSTARAACPFPGRRFPAPPARAAAAFLTRHGRQRGGRAAQTPAAPLCWPGAARAARAPAGHTLRLSAGWLAGVPQDQRPPPSGTPSRAFPRQISGSAAADGRTGPAPSTDTVCTFSEGGSRGNVGPASRRAQTARTEATKQSNLFGVLGLPVPFCVFWMGSYSNDGNRITSTPTTSMFIFLSP